MEIIVAIGLLFFFIWAANLPKPGSSSGSTNNGSSPDDEDDDEATYTEPSRGGHGGQMGCLICGNSASAQCSQCQSFICSNHANRIKLQSGKSVIWCSDCYEEDRQSTQAEVQARIYKCAACKKRFIDDSYMSSELYHKIQNMSLPPHRSKQDRQRNKAVCPKGCVVCRECEAHGTSTLSRPRRSMDENIDGETSFRCKACGHIWSVKYVSKGYH